MISLMSSLIRSDSDTARNVDCERFRQAHAHIITRVGRRMPRAGLQLLRHLERWMRAFNSRTEYTPENRRLFFPCSLGQTPS